jgi:hypothetical protein
MHDQTLSGKSTHELTVDMLTEHVTVRELIRSRVYQEVQDFNRKADAGAVDRFQGLVQPTDAEVELNGLMPLAPKAIDWKIQFDAACRAFQHNGILILIDHHQPTDLDEEIVLTAKSTVNFVKLVPLVGG